MPRKPKLESDTAEQLKRFKEMAREVGADESEGATDRAFEQVVRPTRTSNKPQSPKKGKL